MSRPHVRRPFRTLRRAVQSLKPGERHPAADAGWQYRRLRDAPGQQSGTILEAVLSRIAQKHTSLDIRPVQCSMVYQNPFEAIAEIHWLMAHAPITLENASTPLRPAIAQWSPESWWAKKPTEPTR